MHISGITNYNTNFTALRLKKDSERYLSSLPKKALSYVDSVGEYIKDTKYYHIEIGRDVSIYHVGGERYYYPHNVQVSDKILFLRARGGYNTISKKITFDTHKQAEEARQFISEAETPLVRAARITKCLDEQEIKISGNIKEDINPIDSTEELIRKLMKKYKA